jgi:hypothetical protein
VSSPRRRLATVAIVAVAAVLVILFLVLAPVESSAFQTTANSNSCVEDETCPVEVNESALGHTGYMTFTGSWTASQASGWILFISNGASGQTCEFTCPNLLYSAGANQSGTGVPDVLTGSFDVSGFGPFQLSIVIVSSAASVTVQGTVGTSIL